MEAKRSKLIVGAAGVLGLMFVCLALGFPPVGFFSTSSQVRNAPEKPMEMFQAAFSDCVKEKNQQGPGEACKLAVDMYTSSDELNLTPEQLEEIAAAFKIVEKRLS